VCQKSVLSTCSRAPWPDHNSLERVTDELFTKSNKARALNDNVVCQCYDTNYRIFDMAFTEYYMTLGDVP